MIRTWEIAATTIDSLKAQLEDVISQLDKLKADQADPVEAVDIPHPQDIDPNFHQADGSGKIPQPYTPEEWGKIVNAESVQLAPTFHPPGWGNPPIPEPDAPPGSAPRPGSGLKPGST